MAGTTRPKTEIGGPEIPQRSGGSVVSSLHCINDPQAEGHMASFIERRKFLATVGGAAAWPLAARAQQPERRIGVLTNLASDDAEGQARLAAFHQALQQLGWSDGQPQDCEGAWH